jgi:quercetin dioxygenase-like cupin family protein
MPSREQSTKPQVAHLGALARDAAAMNLAGAVWSLGSADLNLNLMRFADGDGVEAHINAELDVVGLVVAGEGVLELDGQRERLCAGDFFFIPKGTRRALHAGAGDFSYLTCHRRRPGLMPQRARRTPESPGDGR